MEKILGRDLKEKLINELKEKKSLSCCCYTENDEAYDEDRFTIETNYIYLDGNKLDVWAYGYEYWIGESDDFEMTQPSYLTFRETDETYEKLIKNITAYDTDEEDYVTIEDDRYYNIEINDRMDALVIQVCRNGCPRR